MDIIQFVTSILFGTGGIVGALSFIFAWRSRRAGAKANENDARKSLPDWGVLSSYYQKEVEDLRGDLKQELVTVRSQLAHMTRLRDMAEIYIDALLSHIWSGLPPPPPTRPHFDDGEDS